MNAKEALNRLVEHAFCYDGHFTDKGLLLSAIQRLEDIEKRAKKTAEEYPDRAPIQSIIDYILNGEGEGK